MFSLSCNIPYEMVLTPWPSLNSRMVARLDRKRLAQDTFTMYWNSMRGVFDKQTRRKPLAFAADAVRYGI
jgi:hypothetical protein